jgi:lysophospholipase L1-like esterase
MRQSGLGRFVAATLMVVTIVLAGTGAAPASAGVVCDYAHCGNTATLFSGNSLVSNDWIASPNKAYTLVMQGDSNLVEYNSAGTAVWASNTGSKPDGGWLAMQTDGNLVIYKQGSTCYCGTDAYWASGTNGHSGAYLTIQNDGSVVIYDANGVALWTASTPGSGCTNYGSGGLEVGPNGCQGFSTTSTWFSGGGTGLMGKEIWTYANGTVKDSTATYHLYGMDATHLWQLQAYIPNAHSNAGHAHYHYCSPGGGCGDGYINQNNFTNQWVTFATVDTWNGTATVVLADDGGDAYPVEVGADAIRAVRTATSAPPPPTYPSGLTVTATSSTAIRVSWTDNSHGTAQFVLSNGDTDTGTINSGTTSYVWSGLKPGTYMCFTIMEMVSGFSSGWSPYACTTTPVPGPSNVAVVVTGTSTIRVTWTDTSGGGAGFVVGNGDTSSATLPPGTTGYTWGGLSPGTYMCFDVLATEGNGSSPWSPYACATIPIPPVPVGVAATATTGDRIHITWTDTSGGTAQFVVSNGSTTSTSLPAGTTGYDWTGLAQGTSMCFTVKSVNTLGASSAWSSSACATTMAVPPVPTGVAVVPVSGDTVHVSWVGSAAATGYTVSDGTTSQTVTAPTTNLDWSGLDAGAQTCLTVVASDTVGNSAASAPVCATTPANPYAIIGDSYSSGVGAGPYDDGTDSDTNTCMRSANAFGRLYAAGPPEIYAPADVQHLACSGAVIDNLTSTSRNGEPPQISRISPTASLVTVTIGGNDVGFADILAICVLPSTSPCEDQYSQDDDNNLDARIEGLEPRLVAAYTAIRAQAPDASVIAVTYPNLFAPGSEGPSQSQCLGIGFLWDDDVAWLIDETYHLDNVIDEAATAAGIQVLDERYAFSGHELCTADPWVNSLTDQPFSDIDEAFHPNAAGQAALAASLTAELTNPASITPTVWSGWRGAQLLKQRMPTTAQAITWLNGLARAVPAGGSNSFPPWRKWQGPGIVPTDNCKIRDQVLVRDAISYTLVPGSPCKIADGTWQSPYDDPNGPRAFPTGDPYAADSPVDVDHVVSKQDAWDMGANTWSTGRRGLFANDVNSLELITVQGQTNSSKSDRPPVPLPDGWIPDWSGYDNGNPAFTCDFLRMYVQVKEQWHLAVTNDEYTFILTRLQTCDPTATTTPDPGLVTAFPVDGHTIHLNWIDHSDGAATFEISSGTTTLTTQAGLTSIDWGGLNPGDEHCFRVRAISPGGAPSNWVPTSVDGLCRYTAPAGSAPPAPATGLTATAVNSHMIELNWTDNTGGAARYEISNGTVSMFTPTYAGASTDMFDWGGLPPNTPMCFQVRAITTTGVSPFEPVNAPGTPAACATTPALSCQASAVTPGADGLVDFYHGTSLTSAEDIAAHGIDIFAGSRDVDFGLGFYVTTDRDQAVTWAQRFPQAAVVHYRIRYADLAGLCGLVFPDTGGNSYIAYVRAMRTFQPPLGGAGYAFSEGPVMEHPYDLISGQALPASEGQQDAFHTPAGIALLNAGYIGYDPV